MKEVVNLITENSDLPIYAYVATEVVADDMASCYWLGKVKSARIARIAFVEPYGYNDQTVVEYTDTDDYYEYLVNSDEYKDLSDEEADNKAKEEIKNLDYKEVILLHIDTV